MENVNRTYFANPSSIHSLGQQSKVLLESSRKTIANSIGAKTSELVFTSSGTEANNLALIGAVKANKNLGDHVITSKVEHPAILETCKFLSENGYRITYIDVDMNGRLDLNQLQEAISNETILISLMMVNNETGCLLPIKEVAEMIKEKDILFHSDAVQAFGKIAIDMNHLNVDLLTLSAHKIYGPKGCGTLYIRQGTKIEGILYGGSQESGRRPGTENLNTIAGFAEAVNQMEKHPTSVQSLQDLGRLFEEKLKKEFNNLEINGENTPRVPGISNIYFPFMAGDSLLMNLDLHQIAVSMGSACSSGSQKPSHVLKAMGYDDHRVNNSLRFSLGRGTTKDEILTTVDVLKKIYNDARR
jgi:cysteine desulfurase